MDNENTPKKKKSISIKKRDHLDTYKMGASGQYVYTGKYIDWVSDRKKGITLLIILAALETIAAIAAGCIPGTGMEGRFYIVIPYIITLVLVLINDWKIIRFIYAGNRIKEYIFKSSFGKMRGLSISAAVFSSVTFLCEIALLVFDSFSGKIVMLLLFLLMTATVAVCELLTIHLIKSFKFSDNLQDLY